jgi:hypothetical protein
MLANQGTGKIQYMKLKSFFIIKHFAACMVKFAMSEQVLKQLQKCMNLNSENYPDVCGKVMGHN